MFPSSPGNARLRGPGHRRTNRRLICFAGQLVAGFMLLFCAGCHTTILLPPADFSAPGWQVKQGQAVWKPTANRPELTGDLLFATNASGDCFIQFSKMPFPLATAQISGEQWQIEFGADKYTWHGLGQPPERFVWFQLPRTLRGENPGGNWHFNFLGTNSWRLENSHTGETLEGEFPQ